MEIRFRRAAGPDAAELTGIAFAAKRYWDYPEEWIALWADELTVDSAYIDANWVVLATADSRIVGWCAVLENGGEYWLDYCWVRPDAAGKGIGRSLVRRALAYTAGSRSRTLKVIADPHAEGFYRRLGFRLIGDRASQPDGRRLPLLEADVASAA